MKGLAGMKTVVSWNDYFGALQKTFNHGEFKQLQYWEKVLRANDIPYRVSHKEIYGDTRLPLQWELDLD